MKLFTTIEYHGISDKDLQNVDFSQCILAWISFSTHVLDSFTKRAIFSDQPVLPKNEINVSSHSSIAATCKKVFKLLKEYALFFSS
jgi:hypothetical protein